MATHIPELMHSPVSTRTRWHAGQFRAFMFGYAPICHVPARQAGQRAAPAGVGWMMLRVAVACATTPV